MKKIRRFRIREKHVMISLKDTEEDSTASNLETGQATKSSNSNLLYTMLSRIFIQAFTMTFLAEWGDRSQIATIILAARENVTAVVIAGILGHAFCTGLAVLGELPAFLLEKLRHSSSKLDSQNKKLLLVLIKDRGSPD